MGTLTKIITSYVAMVRINLTERNRTRLSQSILIVSLIVYLSENQKIKLSSKTL